jgi:formylglycine-generating enzyme required for sulfatase activity
VPVVGTVAGKVLGELARYGVKRLLEPQAEVPDVKKAGQPFPSDQLDQLNAWLELLTASYAGLLDRLELLVAAGNQTAEELRVLVKQTLLERSELAREFDACAREVRRATLSLARIEDKLERNFHEIERVALAVEEIKAAYIDSPLMGEWAEFRRARPEAVRALNEADAHFLAGRREEGAKVYLGLLQQHGVGTETVCRQLGLVSMAQGRLPEARRYLGQAGGRTMSPGLMRTMIGLSTLSTRGIALPVWRSLPRGFVVARKYRVEEEVGRGGMASVYRAVGVARFDAGRSFALKVPAPDLMADGATRERFEREIEVSRRLSEGRPPHVVATLGYEVFDDPHSGREMYGLVLEFIDGLNLAHYLAQRQEAGKPLTPAEIVRLLRPVCEALEYAHGQSPPVIHRDLKPANVMLTAQGEAKLMDFGIARVLEERRSELTRTGDAGGTPAYMPPEMLLPGSAIDARTDVYLAGNLLLELLTFSPFGDAEARSDCPAAWVRLIADAMNRVRGQRPATIRAFLDRLLEGPERGAAPAPPVKPVVKTLAEQLAEVMASVDRAHEEAKRLAEKEQDYAGAARLIEALPEQHRREKLYAEICRRRDRVAELEAKVGEAVASLRLQGLRPLVEEWLKLQPRRRRELQALLDRLPAEPKEPQLGEVVTNSLGMKLVFLPRGTFWMGDRGSQRQVEIADDFYIGVYPATQEQWQAVMGSNPSYFCRSGGGAAEVKGISDADLKQFPVEEVSWDDVQEFLKRLNARERQSGLLYRLPTEAEWEYACRGGATSQQDCAFDFYLAQPTNDLSSALANFDGNYPAGNAPKGKYLERTSKVGSYQPNRLGIYEMHGNVWEWCEDSYDGGSARVFRGGGWDYRASYCRASLRYGSVPSYRINYLGFRLAAVPSGE